MGYVAILSFHIRGIPCSLKHCGSHLRREERRGRRKETDKPKKEKKADSSGGAPA
jgi:hypothetical protein